jgi:anti-anti-sigma regulatory factor
MSADSEETICPVGALEISEVAPLRPVLLDFIQSSPHPVLDLGRLESGDAAGFQLLCSAMKTAAGMGKTLRCKAVSPPLREAMVRLGLPADFLIPYQP